MPASGRIIVVILRMALNASMFAFLGCAFRRHLLRAIGLPLLADTKISRGTRLGGTHITMGEGFGANEEAWIDDHVTFGRNVRLGPRVTIITQTHPIGTEEQRRGGADVLKPVTIGDGAWLQTNSTILPGAHVAAGCVICAGAVVTRATRPNGMYAGVPARRIRDLA